MVSGELLEKLTKRLKTKEDEDREYQIERKKLNAKISIIFGDLPYIPQTGIQILKSDYIKLGFGNEGDFVNIWIDTTKENRKAVGDDIFKLITYSGHGAEKDLYSLTNERLKKFYENIDILLEELLKRLD